MASLSMPELALEAGVNNTPKRKRHAARDRVWPAATMRAKVQIQADALPVVGHCVPTQPRRRGRSSIQKMVDTPGRPRGNVLLDLLPSGEAKRLFDRARRVELTARDLIADSETPIEHVYFPVTCVLSVLSVMTDRSAVETAVVGHEGMAPLTAFHGVPSAAEQVIVQVPGEALRLTLADFRAAVAESPALRAALHRFAQALFTFAAQTSGCNRRHSVVQRCARWLLVTHDRVSGDSFPLTHLFLSQMLGVRRSSVTLAAEALRAAGAVTYTRGTIRIADRARLIGQSCECYQVVRATYDRLLEGIATRSPLSDVALSDRGKSVVGGIDGAQERADGADITAEALAEFGGRFLEAQRRTQELIARLRRGDRDQVVGQLDREVTGLFEQLHVAGEELRVQVEALADMRHSLEAQQLQWRQRIDALPDAFIETDRDDTIVEVNRAAEELLGRARPYLVGKPLAAFVPEPERRSMRIVVSALRRDANQARWSGSVLGPQQGRRVDASVVVTAPREARPSASGAVRFEGARWLLRVQKEPERTVGH